MKLIKYLQTYVKLYVDKFQNLSKIDTFLRKIWITKLAQKEIKKFKYTITIWEIENAT